MRTTTDDNILYWATQLQKNEEEIRVFTNKMTPKVDTLTYSELYELRILLEQNRSFITLLNQDLDQPEDEYKPTPRWKKLFRK